MLQKRVAEIISALKRVREEEGLTYQRIADLVAENGYTVSLSTVKRVFEPGSEEYHWQYESTLKPIYEAVLKVYGPSEPATAAEADAFKSGLAYKSEKIADLTAQLARCEESYRRRLAFLREQIALKDSRIDRRDAMIEKLLDVVLRFGLREEVRFDDLAVGNLPGAGADLPAEIPD